MAELCHFPVVRVQQKIVYSIKKKAKEILAMIEIRKEHLFLDDRKMVHIQSILLHNILFKYCSLLESYLKCRSCGFLFCKIFKRIV